MFQSGGLEVLEKIGMFQSSFYVGIGRSVREKIRKGYKGTRAKGYLTGG